MNREIKLRIRLKSKSDGKEITLINSVFDAMNGIAFYEIDRSEWEFIGSDEYTGIKDKNGVEIYEGDIVTLNRSSYLGGNFQAEGTIEWHWHKWQWKRLPKFDGDEENGVYPTCDIWASATWLEVIGNIYQNQDLLK